MGRARDGDRRHARERGFRDHAAAGPALHPGAAEPDRQGPPREPRDLHGRRPRGRVASAAAAPGRQPGRAAGSAWDLNAADYVELLEKPASVDRALGDIHPYGNPHLQTDPRNIAKVAAALAERLAMLDAPNAATYKQRYQDFATRWQAAVERWTTAVAPLKGKKVVTHHKGWVYLENWTGLVEVGNLEPKPGLPPSAAHLAELLDQLKGQPISLIIRSTYEDAKASEWLGSRTMIPYVVLPHTVGSVPGADDLFKMFDVLVKTLLEAKP